MKNILHSLDRLQNSIDEAVATDDIDTLIMIQDSIEGTSRGIVYDKVLAILDNHILQIAKKQSRQRLGFGKS